MDPLGYLEFLNSLNTSKDDIQPFGGFGGSTALVFWTTIKQNITGAHRYRWWLMGEMIQHALKQKH